MLTLLILYLSFRLLRNPVYVADPQPRDPPRAAELADRIDPNSADWHTLAALPMIGQKRAQDIIAYRERYLADNPGGVAFRRLDDLARIKGFGPAMIAHVRPYLVFPPRPSPAATRPAD